MDAAQNAPRRQAVSFEDVALAAKTVIAQGNRPTLERIRAVVGGGSYSTLGALFRRWKATPEGAAAPSGPPESLQRAVDHVWDAMISAHEGEMQSVREGADEAIAEESRARELAQAEVERQRRDLETSQRDLSETQREVKQVEIQLGEVRSDLAGKVATIRELNTRLDEQRASLEQVQLAQAEAHRQIKELLDRLAGAEGAQKQLEVERSQASAERDQALAECKGSQLSHEQTKAELSSARLELATLRADVEEANEQKNRALEDLEREKQAALAFARQSANDNAKQLVNERAQAAAQFEELSRRLETIEQRIQPPKSSKSARTKRPSA